jgi:hypothetical protein
MINKKKKKERNLQNKIKNNVKEKDKTNKHCLSNSLIKDIERSEEWEKRIEKEQAKRKSVFCSITNFIFFHFTFI